MNSYFGKIVDETGKGEIGVLNSYENF